MHNADQWEYVIQSVLVTMPDRIDDRLKGLDCLISVVPEGHPRLEELKQSRHHLNRHVNAQRELTLAAADRASAAVQIGGGR